MNHEQQYTYHHTDWFDLQSPHITWLVEGLIPTDGCDAAIGKPKHGKSTLIRNLTTAVILRRPFLGRAVTPSQGGKVIYVHLDRKDRPAQVAKELRDLGITDKEKHQLRFLTEKEMSVFPDYTTRCAWLANHAKEFQPDLIVIDLLLHFMRVKKGVNDYNDTLDAVAELQDALSRVEYKGALMLSLHARKSISEDDPGDNILGSTGIGGSVGTQLICRYRDPEKIYTVRSSQTQRDPAIGNLDETIVVRDSATGRVTSGAKFAELRQLEKKTEWNMKRQQLHTFIKDHPGAFLTEMLDDLPMSKKTILDLLNAMEKNGSIYSTGEGVKGDPKKYSVPEITFGAPKSKEAV
jgi:hypothetical protein